MATRQVAAGLIGQFDKGTKVKFSDIVVGPAGEGCR
jgi:hypothetical protein